MSYQHVPVMVSEAIVHLNCQPGHTYLDGTLGGSGHAMAILKKIDPGGCLIGIDQDLDAIENAKNILPQDKVKFHLHHGNYSQFPNCLAALKIQAVDGMLLDLGLSLHQLTTSQRGFSFQKDEPLDMRMDIRSGTRARDLVNDLSQKALTDLFRTYGEEPWANSIAHRICTHRRSRPIDTSRQLAELVAIVIPRAKWKPGRHPATRIFMALRIVVNKELERLRQFLKVFADYLNPGGRICILTFHSLEDRIVKHAFRALEKPCTCPPDFPKCVCQNKPCIRILTKKGLKPSADEIAANPMARSTILRAAERLG